MAAPANVTAAVANWWGSSGFNITDIRDLRVFQISKLVQDNNGTACDAASKIIPAANLTAIQNVIKAIYQHGTAPNATTYNPQLLNVGIVDLTIMGQTLFPPAINTSSPGAIVNWWQNVTANEADNATAFIGNVVQNCYKKFCSSGVIVIGNPDIVGIGMLVSTGILMALAILFAGLSFSPVLRVAKRDPSRKHNYFDFRSAFVGTVDDLYTSVLIFTLSVLVTSYIFRYTTTSRFDALMADGLSLLCSTTVVMLTATYWQYNERQRPQWTFSVLTVCVLTVVMFATHFYVVGMVASPQEMACNMGSMLAGGSSWTSAMNKDPFDQGGFRFIPFGFGLWCCVCIGAVLHHPALRGRRPARMAPMWWVWIVVEAFPSVMGLAALAVYAVYFWNTWQMMKEAYGTAFTNADEQWGFGQLLALFTWLPPLLTFGHLFFAGKDALLEKLPLGWYRGHSERLPDERDEPENIKMDGWNYPYPGR